jgi:hypothetical protein
MGRIRTIKPEFFKHSELFDAEQETGLPLRLAYAGLWTCCDREGRFKWRPRELKLDVLPFDECDFSRVLDALATRGFLVKYTSPTDEKELFGYIPSWKKHQFINNKEPKTQIPEPPLNQHVDACETRGVKEGKGKEGDTRVGDASDDPSSEEHPEELSPSMVASGVLDDLQLSGRELRVVLDDICRLAMKAGTSADDLRKSLVASWQDYELAKPKLGYTLGPQRFFGDGIWRNRDGWPLKEGQTLPAKQLVAPTRPPHEYTSNMIPMSEIRAMVKAKAGAQ